ncbi:MAG: ferrous iron transport protein B, partial [Enhydrobacter sp.]
MKVLLLGNPNAGKTTLFNALTGENQRIGNWPGVTVEQKKGFFSLKTSGPDLTSSNESVELIDLPGVYSLNAMAQGASPDELITLRSLAHSDADCIINVVDACHLERHLYLTSQLLELGKPVILALNMMDIAALRGVQLDVPELAKELSCSVIPIQAHQQIGMDELKNALLTLPSNPKPLDLLLPASACTAIASIRDYLQQHSVLNFSETMINYAAWRIAEGDAVLVEQSILDTLHAQREGCADLDLILADARYGKIHQLVAQVQSKRSDASEYLTARIDRVVLHRYLAFPFFLAAMYLMFLFAINVGGLFQDFFDISSNAIFVQGSASLLERIHAPQWLIALLAHGVGQGINTTVTFIPVLASMYFFLALLESSGYMARAAFVVDKLMRLLGLPGKAFVPMIVGFGCNVPAIMAARTLDSERDRILTVLMSPFMSCSARLAIYAVFVAAFFPTGGQNIVFSLYLIGILMAVFTGFILRKTTLQGTSSSLILELPAYHRPSLKRLLRG